MMPQPLKLSEFLGGIYAVLYESNTTIQGYKPLKLQNFDSLEEIMPSNLPD